MSIAQKAQTERIEFRCTCGTRFRVDARLAGRRARCKTCNAGMTIPQASTAEPVAAEQEPAKTHERPGQPTERQEVALQALCSICQSPIDDGEDTLACPQCHLPFHSECWQENMGWRRLRLPAGQCTKERAGPDDRRPAGCWPGRRVQSAGMALCGRQSVLWPGFCIGVIGVGPRKADNNGNNGLEGRDGELGADLVAARAFVGCRSWSCGAVARRRLPLGACPAGGFGNWLSPEPGSVWYSEPACDDRHRRVWSEAVPGRRWVAR